MNGEDNIATDFSSERVKLAKLVASMTPDDRTRFQRVIYLVREMPIDLWPRAGEMIVALAKPADLNHWRDQVDDLIDELQALGAE